MFTGHFENDYAAIQRAVTERRPFALSRFCDGEWAVLNGKFYKAASGWVYRGDSWLTGALLESLSEDCGGGYCVGTSPACCHPKCVGYYSKMMRAPAECRTFGTVLFHGNFGRAKAFFSAIDAFLVGCTDKCDLKVPQNSVRDMFDVDAVVQRLLEVDKPILVAAGPAAGIIIHRYWRWSRINPEKRQPIVDIGAILDEKIHGRRTRNYQEPDSGLRQHYCQMANFKGAGQRRVVAVHDSVRGSRVRMQFVNEGAAGARPSPTDQVVQRREAGAQPKWLSGALKKTRR